MIGGQFVVKTIFKAVDKQTPSIRSIGLAAQRTAAGVALIGGVAIVTAAKYQRGMNTVQAVTRLGAKEMSLLSAKARELGRDTEKSPLEIANSMEKLARAGWKYKQILNGIEPLVKGSIANNSDLEVTTKLLTSTMNAFKIPADQASRVMDSISYAASNTAIDVEGLADVMQYGGANAKLFGSGYNDVLLAGGFMADLGVRGSRAGTQIKGMYQKLGANAKKLKKEYGVDVADDNGNLRGFVPIMRDLGLAFKGLPEIDRFNAFKEVFGMITQTGGGAVALDLTDGLSKLDKLIAGEKKATGLTGIMYNIMTKGAWGNFKKMGSALTELAIAINEGGLLNNVTELLKGATDIVKEISGASDFTKTLIKDVAKLVIGVGLLSKALMITSSIASGLSAIKGLGAVSAGAGAVTAKGAGAAIAATGIKGTASALMASLIPIAIAGIVTYGVVKMIKDLRLDEEKAESNADDLKAKMQEQDDRNWAKMLLSGNIDKLSPEAYERFKPKGPFTPKLQGIDINNADPGWSNPSDMLAEELQKKAQNTVINIDLGEMYPKIKVEGKNNESDFKFGFSDLGLAL